MGKTKTAFIGGQEEAKKTSAEKYAEKIAKREALKTEPTTEAPEKESLQEIVTETAEPLKIKKEIAEKQRGKKYLEARAKLGKTGFYKLAEAIKIIKEINLTKFDATMELHLVVKKTGVNMNITLPYSAGKQKKIEMANEKTLEKLKAGKVDFDVLLATADMMPKLVAFAKLLGPRGLMPNPKNGTIIKSAKDADNFGGNTVNIKTEKEAPLIHASFGKVSQKDDELVKNAEIILEKLGGSKTIVRAFVKSTMSPSVKIQV